MFTGIVQATGEVVSFNRENRDSGELILQSRFLSEISKVGDSICVNGVCLTVVKEVGDTVSFDVSYETLKISNLGELRQGSLVNLEPALRADERFGGHFVTGHVDGVGSLRSKVKRGETFLLTIKAPGEILKYMVRKGSVALDGISLTVADVFKDAFSVVIIPHTAMVTTLGTRGVGESINLEVDMIGKYIEKFLSPYHMDRSERDGKLLGKLKEEGYI